MRLTIIIPTYNEAVCLQKTIEFVCTYGGADTEIIVSDGGSVDTTCAIAAAFPVTLLHAPVRGRAEQMNYAAQRASGDILFFLHADCLPPVAFRDKIITAIRSGRTAGCFRYHFDSPSRLLRAQAWFVRLPGIMFRGGDQTLFITKDTFMQIGGYAEHYVVMEDYEIIRRIKKAGSFVVLPDHALVSARKYTHNSWLKVNFANAVAMLMFLSGLFSPVAIRSAYFQLIKHPKAP